MDDDHLPNPGLSAKAEEERDNMAALLDAVPQLESLFVLSRVIGNGTFSSVYLARTKHNTTINGRRHFAIKHIIPTSHPSRVYMELKCLKLIGGADYVMGVTMCFRQMNHIVLVMPHFPHDTFSDYVGCLSVDELRHYLTALLVALKRVHSYTIIHRDVKPANFLYNRKYRRYSLVDFGLAQEVGKTRGSGAKVEAGGRVKGALLGAGGAKSMMGNGRGGGATSKPVSVPVVLDTPLATTTRTVKRKLGVSNSGDGDGEGERVKRSRQLSSPSAPVVCGVLTNSTSRLNASCLRRSPRKPCTLLVSPKKENYEGLSQQQQQDLRRTPQKTQDSPSKHTRGAESCRKLDSLDGGEVKCDSLRALRRSPRKPMGSAGSLSTGPLEAIVKHHNHISGLQNGSSSTPILKTGKLKAECSSRCESGGAQSGPRARQPSHTGPALSPRVSGLTFTPDIYTATATTATKALKTPRLLQEVKTKSGSILCPVSCHCYGSARVCGVCVARSNQVAPRAGTPGFRAPEVLLRHPTQGTGLDMWSVGVILLSLLSGRYPFFRAADDLSTLAEISTLLGTSTLRRAAARIDKLVTCSEERPPLDLVKVCETLRNNTGTVSDKGGENTICPGCRQRNICMCLICPAKGQKRSSLQDTQRRSSLQESHRRSSMQESHKRSLGLFISAQESQRKSHGAMSGSHVSPTKQRGKPPSTSQNLLATHFPQYHMLSKSITLEEGKGSINKASPTPVDDDSSCSSINNPSQLDVTPFSPCLERAPRDLTSSPSSVSQGESSRAKCAPPAYPLYVYHLLLRLLDPDPDTRISAVDALAHPFLSAPH